MATSQARNERRFRFFDFFVLRRMRRGPQRKFQREGGAFTDSVAVRVERATHFLCRNRAAMEAEAMAIFASREAVRKNSREIFRGDANAIVDHLNLNSLETAHGDANDDLAA